MEYLKLTGTPFTDEALEYDTTLHRYRILKGYLLNKLGNTLFGKMTEDERDILIEEQEELIIDYIQSESYRLNWDIIEYRIAKADFRGEYRARIDYRDAVEAQVRYAIRSAGDLLGDQHGVDLKKGTIIADWKKVRSELIISDRVDRILRKRDNPLIMPYELCYELDPDDYRSDY